MRLLNATTKRVAKFFDDGIPPYAILSHTWGENEITFQDLEKLHGDTSTGSNLWEIPKSHPNHTKIEGCCAQALGDGLNWVWIDTCCIDKTDNAELSEAINSMFRWYHDAVVCYVYLSDVADEDIVESASSSFAESRWFTRGWTLQELLAPACVRFYGGSWGLLGTRDSLVRIIRIATGIPETILKGGQLRDTSIAQRMSWASSRVTSRREDIAYCLLGLFEVNMPLLYGEGEKAFIRLQEEIVKTTSDDSIFAWGIDQNKLHDHEGFGLLARSPRDFEGCGGIVRCQLHPRQLYSDTVLVSFGFELGKRSVQMNIPLSKRRTANSGPYKFFKVGALNCREIHDQDHLFGIPLLPASLVNPSIVETENKVLMERPRYMAMIPYAEGQARKITTISVGSVSDVTYETEPQSVIVRNISGGR